MTKNYPGFWINGAPARDLQQVESFLTGDAHDQSKVQWFDGHNFHSIGYVEYPTHFPTNPVGSRGFDYSDLLF